MGFKNYFGLFTAILFVACGQVEESGFQLNEALPGSSEDNAAESSGIQPPTTREVVDNPDDSAVGPESQNNADPAVAVAQVAAPKYPVIFHHGLLDGDRTGTFKDVIKSLVTDGVAAAKTQVSPANTIKFRAEQLAKQIDAVLLKYGTTKVNLVAHSMGGLDARYLISKLGYSDRIASLSTISTPHRGTPVADLADDSFLGKNMILLMMKLMGAAISSGSSVSNVAPKEAIKNLSESYLDDTFNPEVQDDPNVYYQSWAARSGQGTNDRLKSMLKLSHTIISGKRGANDGMVPVSSAKWGNFRGVLDADHLDQIGKKLMDRRRSPFNHMTFYRKLVNELANKGY